MHEKMSFRCLADLPAKDQEALDIFAGRGDLVGQRFDHIMKAQDQPPVRRERGELGRVRRGRAEDREHVCHPGGKMHAEFRDAELAGYRIADTGLALSFERRTRHLTAHVAGSGGPVP